jgi:class 3 adenylate cyclase
VVGNIGSETRAKYGIVGSPVNITQRIQALAGPGEIVISETVYLLTKHEIVITRQFSEVLKGINAEMTMYVLE